MADRMVRFSCACFSMVFGQAPEDLVEVTADLARLDQGAEQMGEDLRVLGAGSRQRRSMLEIEAHLVEDPGQRRILHLRSQNAERPHHREPGIDHRRQLSGDDRDFSQLDPVGECPGS